MTDTASRTALRTHTFVESVIREMTRISREDGSINLAQGYPDFPAPDLLKDAACEAIRGDINQYSITWGSASLREALAAKYRKWYGMDVDAERNVTITCGATEAMAAVMLALVDPGEEVIVHEPCYENYGPDAILAGGKPVYLKLEAPDYRLEKEALEAVITPRTRAIVLNTPNNPSGHVFDREEMQLVADVCQEHDILAITDEIYEHIVYEGEHIPLATLPGMANRTVVVSGMSKTYSVTGWRIGTIVAPAELTKAIKKVHDFLTVGAPAPLQEACAVGINQLGDDFYSSLIEEYRERRDVLIPGLLEAGFKCAMPQGAYYVMADFSELSSEDDFSFSHRLSKEAGVAPVPGSGYYSREGDGNTLVRFVFCKRLDTLREVSDRLRDFAGRI